MTPICITILDQLLVIITNQTFWTALAACLAIPSLYFIYKQLAGSRYQAAYEFLRKEGERFKSLELRESRNKLAKVLLTDPNDHEAIDEYADALYDYFEDLGLMLRHNIVDPYTVWTTDWYYIHNYWCTMTAQTNWVRDTLDDQSYYCEFENLYRRTLKIERKVNKQTHSTFTKEDKIGFLTEELQIACRPFNPTDLSRILEIEQITFPEKERYSQNDFENLYRIHADGFFVAHALDNIIGYVIGYITDNAGEIDSLAIDPTWQKLSIGTRLCNLVLKQFKRANVGHCSLEVDTGNIVAQRLYQKLGFHITDTLKDYYTIGQDAFIMCSELDLANISKRDK